MEQPKEIHSVDTHVSTAKESGGLSIQPVVLIEQAFNFLVLLIALHFILFKPLIRLLAEREKKIKEGVENAEKAEAAVKEATMIRQDMMRRAKVETRQLLESARKSGEEVKAAMLQEAQSEAGKIIKSGHQLVEMEKAKTIQELKAKSVSLIVKAAEKLLREKIDPQKDARLIEATWK